MSLPEKQVQLHNKLIEDFNMSYEASCYSERMIHALYLIKKYPNETSSERIAAQALLSDSFLNLCQCYPPGVVSKIKSIMTHDINGIKSNSIDATRS